MNFINGLGYNSINHLGPRYIITLLGIWILIPISSGDPHRLLETFPPPCVYHAEP